MRPPRIALVGEGRAQVALALAHDLNIARVEEAALSWPHLYGWWKHRARSPNVVCVGVGGGEGGGAVTEGRYLADAVGDSR